MRDAVQMCLFLATLASAHASNRTIQDLCNGDPVCIREEQFFEKERLKNGGDSSPVVTAGVGCVVAFSILAFCIKLYHESRTGEGSESWAGREVVGRIRNAGGFVDRFWRGQPYSAIHQTRQKHAEELVTIVCGENSGTVWVACKPRKNAQPDEPMKMAPIHWFRAAGEECVNPMERYEGPTFGTEQPHMVLDSEGNVHESDQKIVNIGERTSAPFNSPATLGEPCCICLDSKSDIRLFPCGHSVSCKLCFMRTLLTWTNEYTPNCPMCRETVTFFTIHESHSGPLSQPPTRDTSLHSVAREILRHSASLSRKNREARGTPSVSRTSTMMDARPSQEVNCGQIASSSTNTHASDSGRKTLIDLRNVAGRDLHAPGADEGSRRAEEADKATRSARDVHMPHDASGDSQDNFQVHRTQARRMTAASLGPMASSLSAELTFSHECRGISSRRIHEAQRHETRSLTGDIGFQHIGSGSSQGAGNSTEYAMMYSSVPL